jgi:hypothetical protein
MWFPHLTISLSLKTEDFGLLLKKERKVSMPEVYATNRPWFELETVEAANECVGVETGAKASETAKRNRFYLRSSQAILAMLLTMTAVIATIWSARLAGMAEDDSFIHRRIALNYQQQGKPYFNVDQRVMVTSSPVWTVLLTLAGRALPFQDPAPGLEVVLLLMGAAAGYLLVEKLVRRNEKIALAFPALAFVYVCVGDFPSVVGQMETPCAIALILAGLLGVATERSWGMPLLLVACFTRYECVLLFAMTGIWVTARRRWTRLSLTLCVAIASLGVAWLLKEYATVIPNTVIAKSHLYAMTYRQVIGQLVSTRAGALLCVPAAILWWLYGKDRLRDLNQVVVLLGSSGVLLALAYLARKTFVFTWYLPLVWIPISLGVLLWTDTRAFRSAILGAAFAGLLLMPFAVVDAELLIAALRGAPDSVAAFPLIARVHEYRRVGAALDRECPSGSLMTSEIGALGWEFHGKILDAAGLASPSAIRYHPMRIPEERSEGNLGEIPSGFVREARPDLIVSYDFFMESSLPAARKLGYIDYSYPGLTPEEQSLMSGFWAERRMHVLVAPAGRCSPPAVDRAVRAALER